MFFNGVFFCVFCKILQQKKGRVALFIVAFFVFLIIAFLGFEMTCILLKSAYCFDNFFPHVDVASVRTHRGYGNVAVNGGVGVQRVVVPVFMHAVAVLLPQSVAQVLKFVGKVRSALSGQQHFAVGAGRHVDVVNSVVTKQVVAHKKVVNFVQVVLCRLERSVLDGKGNGVCTAQGSLKKRTHRAAVQNVFPKVVAFVYAGKNEVELYAQTQRGKPHAVHGGGTHCVSLLFPQTQRYLAYFKGTVYCYGMAFSALLLAGCDNVHFAEFGCPLCQNCQAFGKNAVIVGNQYFHKTPVVLQNLADGNAVRRWCRYYSQPVLFAL